MRRRVIDFVLRFAGRERSAWYKVLSLIIGAVFFLVLLPAVFIFIGGVASGYVGISFGRMIEIPVALACIILGLCVLLWSTASQWSVGKGTPAPSAPTRRLVIAGPYKYCRNPIELGAIIYYLGIGTLIAGATAGAISFILGFAIGSLYHKLVEEKELEERFGEAYKSYKRNTPFIIPRIRI
ncbi:MAG: hypothetical protein LBC81_00320 [Tannerellaceae bacterium]|jgi:protein-S-isoprenylcysteine O-methyltransferase Ste14|nr:hypothetical protein [Tannerellaceae bacterium]